MKSLIMYAAIAAVGLSSSLAFSQQPSQATAEPKAPASKAHVLTNAELDHLLTQPDKLLLIDVRRPDEVSAVGGFPVYLSIQLDQLEGRVPWIPKDRTIVTVSNHAARAGKAADLLTAKGFKVAGAVGAQTYEKEGGAIAHIAIPPPAHASE